MKLYKAVLLQNEIGFLQVCYRFPIEARINFRTCGIALPIRTS